MRFGLTVIALLGVVATGVFADGAYAPPATTFVRRHVNAGGQELWAIAAGGGKIVTVGTGGEILVSSDAGVDWAPVNSGVTDWLTGVCYGDGQFVAVGDNGRILVSPDGNTWTPAAASGSSPRLNNVIYAAGQYVAVGEQGTILMSTDGQSWQVQPSGVTGWLRGLAYSAGYGVFVAAGQGGSLLLYGNYQAQNLNPTAWARYSYHVTSDDIEAIASITDGSGSFVPLLAGIGGQGTALVGDYWPGPELSLDFAATTTGAANYLRGAAAGDGAIYFAGSGGTLLVGPATAYGPWVAISSGTTSDLNGAAFIGNDVFLVGANETIMESQTDPNSRLLNLSTLASTGSGAGVLTTGFVVAGSASKQVLVRAAGPTLAAFGLAQPLAQPVLTLLNGTGGTIQSDQGWSDQSDAAVIAEVAAALGAFPFAQESADSALLPDLAPGVYSAQVSGAGSAASGTTLLELYDADGGSPASRLVNLSSRAVVSATQALSAGLVIGGTQPRRVLVRALGPALAAYGISNPLTQPKLAIYSAQSANGGPADQSLSVSWTGEQVGNVAELIVDEAMAGAVPLAVGSDDQMLVETLAPGAWTVQVTSGNGSSGVAVVEVYDLP